METAHYIVENMSDLDLSDLEILAQNIKNDKLKAFIAACIIEIRCTKDIKRKNGNNDAFTPANHFLNVLKRWKRARLRSYDSGICSPVKMFDISYDADLNELRYFNIPDMDFDYTKTSFKKTRGTILRHAICMVYEDWCGWNSEQMFNYENDCPYTEPFKYSIKECLGDITHMIWAQYMEDYKKYQKESWDAVYYHEKVMRDKANEEKEKKLIETRYEVNKKRSIDKISVNHLIDDTNNRSIFNVDSVEQLKLFADMSLEDTMKKRVRRDDKDSMDFYPSADYKEIVVNM